jgi:hypothetical protein
MAFKSNKKPVPRSGTPFYFLRSKNRQKSAACGAPFKQLAQQV